jgi:hypothetical protein
VTIHLSNRFSNQENKSRKALRLYMLHDSTNTRKFLWFYAQYLIASWKISATCFLIVMYHRHCSMHLLKIIVCFKSLIVASRIDQYEKSLANINVCSNRYTRNTRRGYFLLCCLKPGVSHKKHRLWIHS